MPTLYFSLFSILTYAKIPQPPWLLSMELARGGGASAGGYGCSTATTTARQAATLGKKGATNRGTGTRLGMGLNPSRGDGTGERW